MQDFLYLRFCKLLVRSALLAWLQRTFFNPQTASETRFMTRLRLVPALASLTGLALLAACGQVNPPAAQEPALQSAAVTERCADNAANPFKNCSFETGDFTGWITQDLSKPLIPLKVAADGTFDGAYAVSNGFDGNGPGHILVCQDVAVPGGKPLLTFDYQARVSNLGTQSRVFRVTFLPADAETEPFSHVVYEAPGGGGIVKSPSGQPPEGLPIGTTGLLEGPPIMIPGPVEGPPIGTAEPLEGKVDLSEVAGATGRLCFDWEVPEDYTGPGSASLDNVNLTDTGTATRTPQTVSFTSAAPTTAQVGGSYTPTAEATSGLAVEITVTSEAPDVCGLSGNEVVFINEGTCTLSASQAGNDDFEAAVSAQQSFTVSPAPLPEPLADTYLIDFESAPANRLVYSVKLGSGVVHQKGSSPKSSTVPVVGKRRLNGRILEAHLAKVVSVHGSKRLVIAADPKSSTPAPTGGRVKLSFTNFDPHGVTLTSLTLSNLTAKGAHLTFYYADGTSSRQPLGTTAKGGSLVVPLEVKGLRAVDVYAPNAYAVDDVRFTVEAGKKH